jgi:hypothetical protein
VSILPIPSPVTLPDRHGYMPFRSILKHALMMKKFKEAETKDPKWHSLASCKKIKWFLQGILRKGQHAKFAFLQLAVGLLVCGPAGGICRLDANPIGRPCTLEQ